MREVAPGATPGIGLWPAVPAEEYHAWDAASNSRLTRLLRSPAHLRAYMDEQPERTPALVLGDAIHKAILEPDLFRGRFVRAPEGDGRTKAVQEARRELMASFPRATMLTAADFDCALAVRDSVWCHPAARKLLRAAEHVEASAVWRDEDAGVLCKARADALVPEFGTIVDIKSTVDAGPGAFERSLWAYAYFQQGAFYLDGFSIVLASYFEHFVNIAVEKEPPYAVALYRIREDAIAAGRERIRPLLHLYRQCMETGRWPAYSTEVLDISLPPYAWAKLEAS
jgi:hypothetical protein